MGHITHLRKQFKSINTYNLNTHHPRKHCAKYVEIGQVVLEKIFELSQYIFAIS